MVPASYHPFFSASASVIGALIGLLFVAISVVPHKLSGERASTDFRARAGLAFSSLVDALVLALYALLPGRNLGEAGLAGALFGLSAVLGLGLSLLRGHHPRRAEIGSWRWWWSLVAGTGGTRSAAARMAALLAVYVLQLANSVGFVTAPDGRGDVGLDATIVVVLSLFAIDRAWELLGGSGSGLLGALVRLGPPGDHDGDHDGRRDGGER